MKKPTVYTYGPQGPNGPQDAVFQTTIANKGFFAKLRSRNSALGGAAVLSTVVAIGAINIVNDHNQDEHMKHTFAAQAIDLIAQNDHLTVSVDDDIDKSVKELPLDTWTVGQGYDIRRFLLQGNIDFKSCAVPFSVIVDTDPNGYISDPHNINSNTVGSDDMFFRPDSMADLLSPDQLGPDPCASPYALK